MEIIQHKIYAEGMRNSAWDAYVTVFTQFSREKGDLLYYAKRVQLLTFWLKK